MEGKQNLRFSPRMPDVQPERATVDAILKNAQQHFYALKMGEDACRLGVDDAVTLAWREVADCMGEYPVQLLEEMMWKAVEKLDFETAARIRDIIAEKTGEDGKVGSGHKDRRSKRTQSKEHYRRNTKK